MENVYYLVPVTAKAVKFEGTSLFDMLNVVDSELYLMMKEEMELKYVMDGLTKEEMIAQEECASKVSQEIGVSFDLKRLPNQIVVVKSGNELHELATELPIMVKCEAYLEVFKRNSEAIVEYFLNDEDYSNKASNFFNSFLSKGKVLEKDPKKN